MSNFSVLDASGALAVLLGQPASAAIEPLLREDRILIAPDLFISEITKYSLEICQVYTEQ